MARVSNLGCAMFYFSQSQTAGSVFHSHLPPLWPLSSSCPVERDTYSNGLTTRGVHFEEAHRARMEDGWRKVDKMRRRSQGSGRISIASCWHDDVVLDSWHRLHVFGGPSLRAHNTKVGQDPSEFSPYAPPLPTQQHPGPQPKHTICPDYRPPASALIPASSEICLLVSAIFLTQLLLNDTDLTWL